MRGVISTLFSILYVNRRLKYVVYDSVPKKQFKNLFIRGSQATLLILIQFTIAKYLSLVYIGLAQNITPLVTVVMSFYMTGERIKRLDLALIFVTFIGVTLVTLGFAQDDDLNKDIPLLASIGAFSVPFLLSYGNILMSKMKGLDENTVSLYINPTLGLAMYFTMVYQDLSF